MNGTRVGKLCAQLINPSTNPALFEWTECNAACPFLHECRGLQGFPSVYKCMPSGFGDGNVWVFGAFLALAITFIGVLLGILAASVSGKSNPEGAASMELVRIPADREAPC